MTGQPRLRIDEIAFTSKDRETSAGLDLSAPFSFIYGASNTGKSFAVKAIDFMLGGNRELPDINERKPFQRIAMAMRVDDREFHLERAVVGGDFSMRGDGVESRILSTRNKKDRDFTLENGTAPCREREGRSV